MRRCTAGCTTETILYENWGVRLNFNTFFGCGWLGLAIASWCFAILFGYAGYIAVTAVDYLNGLIFVAITIGLFLTGVYFSKKRG